MLKVGLIGSGGISGAHVPSWEKNPYAEAVAICDIRPEMMDKYPQLRHYTDFDTMLEQEELDIIDICLPTYLHAEYAIKAMDKGLHVITEKPISLREEDIARIYAAAERNNVKFMVAQVLRFWPAYSLVRQLHTNGRYGKVLSANMYRLGCYPASAWEGWMMKEELSGLVPFDLHIHDSDFLVYTFGDPKNVTTFRSKKPDQDYITAIYEFDGFFVNTQASWYASPYPFTAEFIFQFEEAVVAYQKGKVIIYQRDGKILNLSDPEADHGGLELSTEDPYAAEIRYFTECIVNNGDPKEKVSPQSLTTVMRILKSL